MSVDSIYHPHRCARCRRALRSYHTSHLSGHGVSFRLGDRPHGHGAQIHTGSVAVVSPCHGCKTTTLGRAVIRNGRLRALFEHHGSVSRMTGSWPSRRGRFFSFLPFRGSREPLYSPADKE